MPTDLGVTPYRRRCAHSVAPGQSLNVIGSQVRQLMTPQFGGRASAQAIGSTVGPRLGAGYRGDETWLAW